MEPGETASCRLAKKLQILDKIAANTETQGRFIRARKMKGLKRVLRERAALIEGLRVVNEELAGNQGGKNQPGLTALLQDIADKQQTITDRSGQVLRQAVAERARIAAELKNSRAQRLVKNQYTNPWAVMMRGRLINERG